MSDNKEKNFVQEIADFFKQSRNFIVNCQKPDKKGKYNIIKYHFYLKL